MSTAALLQAMLGSRLGDEAKRFVERSRDEIARGMQDDHFYGLFSLASRFVKKTPLAPSADERASAAKALPGFDPERWTELEAARVVLLLARGDLAAESGARAIAECFRYADVGEQAALLRSLAHLPGPERFLDRAREGARSNMRVLFEATVCDTPYPSRYFDALGFRQLAIKALFVEAPLWRVFGLDERVDAELARMALDLADERRSAGRAVNPQLWLCIGRSGGERGIASIELELTRGDSRGRAAAALALARAGELDRLRSLVAVERDEMVREAMTAALGGRQDQRAFRDLDPTMQGAR